MDNVLSRNIDTNKIFVVWFHDITGNRFDPSFYRGSFYFKSNIYNSYKLSDCAYINPNTSFSQLDENSEISFVPMDAINEKDGIIEKKHCKKVSECKGYTKFKDNDLIWAKITPCMQNGNSAIVRNAKQGYAFGSTEFFVIRPKTDNLLVEYIYILLRDKRILSNAMNYFGGSAGQQRVSKDFLINFKFPLPPITIQKKIVNLYDLANQKKQQRETRAKELLASIDDYLLGELGIQMPDNNNIDEEHVGYQSFNLNKQNSLVKNGRLFLTRFKEVGGGRLDPDYISKIHYIETLQSKYPFVTIKDILIKQPQYGANEEAIDGNRQTNIRYIRITDIDDIGNLKQFGWKTAVNIEKKYLLSYNDVLFARSGSVGKCYIHKETANPAIFAGYLIRFVFNKDVNSDYIFYYCNSKLYWLWIDAIQRPAVQSNINSEEYKLLKIPLPPIEKQNEIALHISEIRKKAKHLQTEAANVLENAKQEVEQLILGK